jgi:hypothetical protein
MTRHFEAKPRRIRHHHATFVVQPQLTRQTQWMNWEAEMFDCLLRVEFPS